MLLSVAQKASYEIYVLEILLIFAEVPDLSSRLNCLERIALGPKISRAKKLIWYFWWSSLIAGVLTL